MDEIELLLCQMRKLEPEVHVYGAASDDLIYQLEAAFGHKMPSSYRDFLTIVGGVSILDHSYSGILNGKIAGGRGWALSDTQMAREYCQLPEQYLVVQPDEDGYKCIDFGHAGLDGEHPVIYHMPFRDTPFHRLARSFRDWLIEDLQAMIEAWKDNEPSDRP